MTWITYRHDYEALIEDFSRFRLILPYIYVHWWKKLRDGKHFPKYLDKYWIKINEIWYGYNLLYDKNVCKTKIKVSFIGKSYCQQSNVD